MSSGILRRVALVRTDVSEEIFLQEPHGVTSQKTPFFIVTAVKTSNLKQKYRSDAIAYAAHIKTSCGIIHLFMRHHQCDKYSCHVCQNLKIVTPLLVLQLDYMKLCTPSPLPR
jgi:hypothetical protein